MEESSVIEKFKVIRKKQFYMVTPAMIAMIALIALLDNSQFRLLGMPRLYLFVFAIIVLVPCVIFSIKNWRCPSCKAYLRKNVNPIFCPKCGVRLQNS